jgi:hypothetical protein
MVLQQRARRFLPATEFRLERLRVGVPLSETARAAGLSLARASEIERFPNRARPGEIDRLVKAIRSARGDS